MMPDLTRAIAEVHVVLRQNDDQKDGEWARKSVLHHLRRGSAHATSAALMIVARRPHGAVYAEHTLDEHVSHAATRFLMALEMFVRGGNRG